MAAVPIGPGEAHVWYALPDDFADPARVAALEALLDAGERARQARFRFARDRQLFLVAHGLLRATLGRVLDADPAALRFRAGPHGKPELDTAAGAPPLQFNLSHTTGLVAWVVTRHAAAGIDVEDRRPVRQVEEVAAHSFAPAELADVRARRGDDQRDRFLEYWTLKEAYVKARGAGLSLPLDAFTMRLAPPGAPTVTFAPALPDDAAAWQFAQPVLSDQHAAAVALQAPRRLELVVRRHGPSDPVV